MPIYTGNYKLKNEYKGGCYGIGVPRPYNFKDTLYFIYYGNYIFSVQML